MSQVLLLGSFLTTSILIGAMLFFSFLVAPVVFIKLETKTAGKFIRSIFPHYYIVIIILSLISAFFSTFANHNSAIIMWLVFLLGLYSRQILMPKLNILRDSEIAGEKSAKRKFDLFHRLSVSINVTQLILLIFSIYYVHSSILD